VRACTEFRRLWIGQIFSPSRLTGSTSELMVFLHRPVLWVSTDTTPQDKVSLAEAARQPLRLDFEYPSPRCITLLAPQGSMVANYLAPPLLAGGPGVWGDAGPSVR